MLWYLKQLVPLSYWTRYSDDAGKQHLCLWHMWFGRCFDITVVVEG